MAKFYLASRFGRQSELQEYRDNLRSLGHIVTSSWLDIHPSLEYDEKIFPEQAEQDLWDIERADALIAFTESPISPHSRGGRHVELGYALGLEKQIMIVNWMENIFCFLPRVHYCKTWLSCLDHIREEYHV